MNRRALAALAAVLFALSGGPVFGQTETPSPEPSAAATPPGRPPTLPAVVSRLSFTPPAGWYAFPVARGLGPTGSLGVWGPPAGVYRGGPRVYLSAFSYPGTLDALVDDSIQAGKAAATPGEVVGEPVHERHCGITPAVDIRVEAPSGRKIDSMAILVAGVAYIARYERTGADDPAALAALATLCERLPSKLT